MAGYGRASDLANHAWPLALQQGRALTTDGCALFCLTSLGYSNFFKLLFIFKLTPRAFLSIKIRAFLLKVRQNTLEAQYE